MIKILKIFFTGLFLTFFIFDEVFFIISNYYVLFHLLMFIIDLSLIFLFVSGLQKNKTNNFINKYLLLSFIKVILQKKLFEEFALPLVMFCFLSELVSFWEKILY